MLRYRHTFKVSKTLKVFLCKVGVFVQLLLHSVGLATGLWSIGVEYCQCSVPAKTDKDLPASDRREVLTASDYILPVLLPFLRNQGSNNCTFPATILSSLTRLKEIPTHGRGCSKNNQI